MRLLEMVKKKSKHHSICDVVMKELKSTKETGSDKPFYQKFFEEYEYKLDKISPKTFRLIEGEDDLGALRLKTKNGKRYGVLAEVKCNKGYEKALLQLAKDKRYFKNLYRLDRVFCLYITGYPNDKTWEKYKVKWIPEKEIDKIIIK